MNFEPLVKWFCVLGIDNKSAILPMKAFDKENIFENRFLFR